MLPIRQTTRSFIVRACVSQRHGARDHALVRHEVVARLPNALAPRVLREQNANFARKTATFTGVAWSAVLGCT